MLCYVKGFRTSVAPSPIAAASDATYCAAKTYVRNSAANRTDAPSLKRTTGNVEDHGACAKVFNKTITAAPTVPVLVRTPAGPTRAVLLPGATSSATSPIDAALDSTSCSAKARSCKPAANPAAVPSLSHTPGKSTITVRSSRGLQSAWDTLTLVP